MDKYLVKVPMNITLDIAVMAASENQAIFKSGEFRKTGLCGDCQNKFTLGDMDETKEIQISEYKKNP